VMVNGCNFVCLWLETGTETCQSFVYPDIFSAGLRGPGAAERDPALSDACQRPVVTKKIEGKTDLLFFSCLGS